MDTSLKARLDELRQVFNRNRVKRFRAPYDMKEVLECIEQIGNMFVSGFKIDHDNHLAFIDLIKYFFADQTFTGDLYGGLLLRGAPRTGKTLALMIMNRVSQLYDLHYEFDGKKYGFQFFIEDTGDIARKYEDKGNSALKNGNTKRLYCLDDLGFENNLVKFYSGDCNVVREIITCRDMLKKTHGFITAATTNYKYDIPDPASGKRIFVKLYGDRVELRMKGMFTEIIFKGNPRI
jgi:hypothetical protein